MRLGRAWERGQEQILILWVILTSTVKIHTHFTKFTSLITKFTSLITKFMETHKCQVCWTVYKAVCKSVQTREYTHNRKCVTVGHRKFLKGSSLLLSLTVLMNELNNSSTSVSHSVAQQRIKIMIDKLVAHIIGNKALKRDWKRTKIYGQTLAKHQ